MKPLAYFTSDLAGIGGLIKQRAEDFRVEELPLAGFDDGGPIAVFWVTKRGLTTRAAAARIAKYLHVPPSHVGYAGLKDAAAVTSQWMSVEGIDPRRLTRFRNPDIRIEDIRRRSGNLRVGQLAGNRFSVRIRGVGSDQLAQARRILDVLIRRGVPNYFGEQRFGSRDDNSALGEALVRGDYDRFVAIYLGRPGAADPPASRAARAAFDAGDLRRALRTWPKHVVGPRNALAALMKRRTPKAVLATVDKRLRRLFISAFQGGLFNAVLARRIDSIDRVAAGDIVQESATGQLVPVADADAAKALVPRAKAFDVSPTGPLPGHACPLADGEPGRIERAVLTEHGVSLDVFAPYEPLDVHGSRRPLRFRPADANVRAGADRHGPHIQVQFTTPPGCYATVLLAEITKARDASGHTEPTDSGPLA